MPLPVRATVLRVVETQYAAATMRLVDDAVRHIAARGWVMPDGTHTSVHLLQFNSTMYPYLFYVEEIAPGLVPSVSVVGAREAEVDESWPAKAEVPHVDRYAFDEAKPRDLRSERKEIRKAFRLGAFVEEDEVLGAVGARAMHEIGRAARRGFSIDDATFDDFRFRFVRVP